MLIEKVKAQVSEVKGVMMENIEKVLDRARRIGILVDKNRESSLPQSVNANAFYFPNKGTMVLFHTELFKIGSHKILGHKFSQSVAVSIVASEITDGSNHGNQTDSQPTSLDEDAAPKAVNNEALLADIEAEPLATTTVVTPAEGLAFGKVKLVAVDNRAITIDIL
ncbi:vesicle-associated membrane protein 721-like protein [Tanacetum coccineum]